MTMERCGTIRLGQYSPGVVETRERKRERGRGRRRENLIVASAINELRDFDD